MQVANGQPLPANGKTSVARQFVGDEFEQRALAAPVRPEQAHHAVAVDLPREIFKDWFRDISDCHTVQIYGDHSLITITPFWQRWQTKPP